MARTEGSSRCAGNRRLRTAGGIAIGALLAGGLLVAGPTYGQSYTFTHLAGPAGRGAEDGTGSAARFAQPAAVAVDAAGNIIVADRYNHTIRRVSPAGGVTTLAGLEGVVGSTNGTGIAARFSYPSGVAMDAAGNVFVADESNHAIRKITPSGAVTTLAGLPGAHGSADGIGSAARFLYPAGVATDATGNVYVTDSGNHTIRKVTPTGVVTTLAGHAGEPGSADGSGSAARFSGPTGVAAGNGILYVADEQNDTIRAVSLDGEVTTLAGLAGNGGSQDGTGPAARFNWPAGIAVGGAGDLFVADWGNMLIRKVTPGGVVTTLAGLAGTPGSADGTGSAARFSVPTGVAVNASGIVYVADSENRTIRAVSIVGEVSTLAGLAGGPGSQDGIGSAARFYFPSGVAIDELGNGFVADRATQTIRKVAPDGEVTTFAGVFFNAGSQDGIGSEARFRYPSGIAADRSGHLYVADTDNHTIRKVSVPGQGVTTLAGLAGESGGSDGVGPLARFSSPSGVAVDGDGNVYVADRANHTIRMVTPGGTVSTLAGLSGTPGSADGTGSAARFRFPAGVALDVLGNVYVTDSENHTIRKVTPAGVVTTVAGLPGALGGADGTGSAARFSRPTGIAADAFGSLWVADGGNHAIRKVTPAGEVTTVAGAAGVAGSVDGTGSAARFYYPSGVAVGGSGEVLVADTSNQAVRVGRVALADVAVIDEATGPVGQARQLDTAPQAATTWLWEQSRVPAGSTATLSSTSIRNPGFTPDVEGIYVFRLTAAGGPVPSITTVTLSAWLTPAAAVGGVVQICIGELAEIQATLTGSSPWSVTWSDSVTQSNVESSPVSRLVSPSATRTYGVTAVSNPYSSGASIGVVNVVVHSRPEAAPISAPASLWPDQPFTASVPGGANLAWTWMVTNGVVTSGAGTPQVEITAGPVGPVTISVNATDILTGCASPASSVSIPVALAATAFHSVVPCRLFDTRVEVGESAASPALGPGETRTFPVDSRCGIPSAVARVLSVNLTVTGQAASGDLLLYRGDLASGPISNGISFVAGKTRANNGMLELSRAGDGTFKVVNRSTGTLHFILDVSGYFR